MGNYRLSLGITTGMSIRKTRWIIENADMLGAHGIWIGEDIGRGQDVFVLTTAALMGTSNARIGTGIIPIVTHDFMRLARAVATLHDLDSKRFVFGTGIGGMQDLQREGISIERPVTLLRESIRALHRLWGGENVSLNIPPIHIESKSLDRKTAARIPLFLGVRGPQMLKLAGETADGVILSGPEQYIKWAVDRLRKSAREVGRDETEIEIVVWNPVVLDTASHDGSLLRKIVAIVASDTPDYILDLLNINQDGIADIRRAIQDEGLESGAALVDDKLTEMFCISGTTSVILDRFGELARIGASEIVVGSPFTGEWKEAVENLFTTFSGKQHS